MCKKDQLFEYSIQDIIDMLSNDQSIEYDEAMNKFYNSEVFEKLISVEFPKKLEEASSSFNFLQEERFNRVRLL